MRKDKRAPAPPPVDDFWDSRNVKTAKSQAAQIRELMKRAGCRKFSDYVRSLIRLEIARGNL